MAGVEKFDLAKKLAAVVNGDRQREVIAAVETYHNNPHNLDTWKRLKSAIERFQAVKTPLGRRGTKL